MSFQMLRKTCLYFSPVYWNTLSDRAMFRHCCCPGCRFPFLSNLTAVSVERGGGLTRSRLRTESGKLSITCKCACFWDQYFPILIGPRHMGTGCNWAFKYNSQSNSSYVKYVLLSAKAHGVSNTSLNTIQSLHRTFSMPASTMASVESDLDDAGREQESALLPHWAARTEREPFLLPESFHSRPSVTGSTHLLYHQAHQVFRVSGYIRLYELVFGLWADHR